MDKDQDIDVEKDPKAKGGVGVESKPKEDKDKEKSPEELDDETSRRAFVKLWQEKITKAKKEREPDFARMRENMDFVAGIQWANQKQIRFNKYIINMTLRAVNQGVAMLYARDPKVSVKRRKRLDYQLWDGKMESIQQVMQILQVAQQAAGMGLNLPVPPDVQATMADFTRGRQREDLLNKIAQTLEILAQYQIDAQQPRFKLQMKQLVRRTRVCGVGFIKTTFCREYESELTQSETRDSLLDRARSAQGILEKMEKDKVDATSPEVQRLKALVASMGGLPLDYQKEQVKERIVFDFPKATSIIVDPACRAIKGFVGAHWIAEEFHYPLDFVNSFFEVKIEPSNDLKMFNTQGLEIPASSPSGGETKDGSCKVRLWEVQDLDTKSRFIICDGYKDFVEAQEPICATKYFWNIVPVTFNDIEVEEGCKASIYPPSDVDLMWSSQIEWNTVRNELSKHRAANGPRYMYADGSLDDDDLNRLANADSQDFVKLKGIQPGVDVTKVVAPLQTAPIRPEVYETDSLREDILLATGQQEANIGPAQPNVTATVGNIAEQSRMSVASSDVDGLDDSMTEAWQCAGELMIREMSKQTVVQIAGIGAAWPETDKESFINEIELEIQAGSSGRPNKAIDIANWEKLAQLLIQAGANPQAVIRHSIKVLDANIDPAEFFPLPGGGQPQGSTGQQGGPPSQPNRDRNPAQNGPGGKAPSRTPGRAQA